MQNLEFKSNQLTKFQVILQNLPLKNIDHSINGRCVLHKHFKSKLLQPPLSFVRIFSAIKKITWCNFRDYNELCRDVPDPKRVFDNNEGMG